ncbi:MAG TPA: hypothetical protein VG943_07705 [Caulobacterales bacterium]|nr:hypothetical protein [Caulobacterales bacterium]
MRIMSSLAVAALAACASACVELTSPTPLFPTADRALPAPIEEGAWVAIDEDCPREALQTQPLPKGCQPFELHQGADGVWVAHGLERGQNGQESEREMRFVIAPATENVPPNTYAPLYVAEHQNDASPPAWSYVVIAPIGTLPAHEVFVLGTISCDAALRDGPINGVRSRHDAHGALTACTASKPSAVREAARRAMIQALPTIDETRLVHLEH